MVCNYSNTIAIKYGINAALIAGYIREKLEKTDFYSGDVPWERITIKKLTGTFPFLGEKAVRNAIKRLKKGNILISKQYGKEHFDHANYYSITAHGYAVMRGDEKMTEKRMAGTYEIIHAFEIGKKEIIIGKDDNASSDERFVVADYENNGIFERYVNALVGNDYAEISKIFAERIKNEAELVIEEISKIEVDTTPIYADGCTVIKSEDTIKNKVVVIRTDVFKPEYQIATMQLQLCTGGFGAERNSRGSACFCTNLYSGKESRYERRDILGVIEKDKLPEWAKQRLDEIQKERAEKRKERDAR